MQQLIEHYRDTSSERLLVIWVENERDEYLPETFKAIEQILADRGCALPEQAAPGQTKLRRDFDWDLGKVKSWRKKYWIAFYVNWGCIILMACLPRSFGETMAWPPLLLLMLLNACCFFYYFAKTARVVFKLESREFVVKSFLIIIPFYLILLEYRIWKAITMKENLNTNEF